MARGNRLGPAAVYEQTHNIGVVRARLIAGTVLAGVILVCWGSGPSLPPPGFGRSVDIGLVSGTVIVTPLGGHSFVLGSGWTATSRSGR